MMKVLFHFSQASYYYFTVDKVCGCESWMKI